MLASLTRRYISELIKKTARLLRVESAVDSGKRCVAAEATAHIIKRIGTVCEYLCLEDDDQAGRLLQAYRDETLNDGTRDEIKRLLFEKFSDSPECEAVAGDMLDDPDPRSRLSAARALGPRGFDTLSRIAKAPDVPKDVREAALADLITKTDSSTGLKLLADAIGSPSTRGFPLDPGHDQKAQVYACDSRVVSSNTRQYGTE